MDKMKMHTLNLADENYRKLAALFPNAVTESVDPETGEVVRAIDADVLRQEISVRVVEGREERYQFTWPDKKKAMLAANAPIAATLRPILSDSVNRDGSICPPRLTILTMENAIFVTPRTCTSRATTWMC